MTLTLKGEFATERCGMCYFSVACKQPQCLSIPDFCKTVPYRQAKVPAHTPSPMRLLKTMH